MAPGLNQVANNPPVATASMPAVNPATPLPPTAPGVANPAPNDSQLAKMVADQAIKTPAKGNRKLTIIAGICALLALVVITMVVVQQLR